MTLLIPGVQLVHAAVVIKLSLRELKKDGEFIMFMIFSYDLLFITSTFFQKSIKCNIGPSHFIIGGVRRSLVY